MAERSQFGQLTLSRIRGMLREPEAVFWMLVFPLILTVVLGWAFRETKQESLPIVVLATDGAGERLAERLRTEPLLEVELSDRRDGTSDALRYGKIAAYVEPGIDGAPPEVTVDPQRPDAELARLRIEYALLLADRDGPPATVTEVRQRGSRYIDWLFPGILGMNLMGTGIWGIGFAIADMRQKRLIRRLLVTPMRKEFFLLSFLTGRLVFLVAELALIGGFGFFVLGVPLRGSLFSFAAICFLGMLTFACLGLLTVARARTIEGASGVMNLVVMPMWLLSGVFFSYERFPDMLHPLLRALPLTALNDALRKNALEAAELVDLLPELGTMAVWSLATFLIAIRVFRWE